MRKLAVVVAAALVTACGDPLLFAELEIPSVQITLPSQAFQAATPGPENQCPPPNDTNPNCLYEKFTYDIGSQVPVLKESNVKAEVRLTELGIRLTAGALQDFGTVDQVTISILAPAGSGLQDVVVAEYTKSAADPNPTAITVQGYSNVDVAAYVQTGTLIVTSQMIFNTATPDFTADVTSDFYLKVQLDYGAYVGI